MPVRILSPGTAPPPDMRLPKPPYPFERGKLVLHGRYSREPGSPDQVSVAHGSGWILVARSDYDRASNWLERHTIGGGLEVRVRR